MAVNFPRSRRRRSRAFRPGSLVLERRELLSLDLTMPGPIYPINGRDTGRLELASFAVGTGTIADYTASISWGDGTPDSPAEIGADASGIGEVFGERTYTSTGPVAITVTVSGER